MMLMVLMMNMMILEKMRSTKDLVTGHLKILWLHTNVTLSIILMRTQLSKRHNYDIEYEDLGDDKDDDVDGLDGQPHLVQEETKQQGVHRCQPGSQLQITEITFSVTSSREKKRIHNFLILIVIHCKKDLFKKCWHVFTHCVVLCEDNGARVSWEICKEKRETGKQLFGRKIKS